MANKFDLSWHKDYDCAYVFVGNLPYELNEGDVLTVFSQFGEIVDVNLIRDKDTNRKKGFGYVGYMDNRSTDIAVDNMNGSVLMGRTLKVDHIHEYKYKDDTDPEERFFKVHGKTFQEMFPDTTKRKKKQDKDKKSKERKKSKKNRTDLLDEDPMKEYILKKR